MESSRAEKSLGQTDVCLASYARYDIEWYAYGGKKAV